MESRGGVGEGTIAGASCGLPSNSDMTFDVGHPLLFSPGTHHRWSQTNADSELDPANLASIFRLHKYVFWTCLVELSSALPLTVNSDP